MNDKLFRIEIYSDIACPWCYVGHRNLVEGLRYYRRHYADELQPEVIWRPFMLHSKLPREGVDRHQYLKTLFPGRANDDSIFQQVTKAGSRVGIKYRFDLIQVQPSTLDAHRLIQYAARHELEEPVSEGLFSAFFCEGRNVSDHEELVRIGSAAGLEADTLRRYLESDEDAEAIRERDELAKRRVGVTTVPFLVLNGRKGVSAVQKPDVIYKALQWARKDVARPKWMPAFL